MNFELPEPNDIVNIRMHDGAVIRVRRHGNPEGPRLVLCHGNGFAIDGYYPFWRNLLTDFDVVLYDQRNHGWNPLFGSHGHNVDGFARDMETLKAAIPAEFGGKPMAGLFHSVSSLAALVNLMDHGLGWEALVLLDPPFIPTPGHELHELCFTYELFLANWSMTRPNEFDSPKDLAAGFRQAKGLARWVDGAHDLMAQAVTRQDEATGRFTLICPRELESATYVSNAYSRVWSRLGEVGQYRDHILVCASDPEMEGQKSPAFVNQVAAKQIGWRHVPVENTTHLLQIERPDHIAALVVDFLKEKGFA